MRFPILLMVLGALAIAPAMAQIRPTPNATDESDQPTPLPTPTPSPTDQVGHVADSTAGRAGQRQTVTKGIQPLARIANRIESRIENRIRSRIDQDNTSNATAAGSFVAAQDRTRNTGGTR